MHREYASRAAKTNDLVSPPYTSLPTPRWYERRCRNRECRRPTSRFNGTLWYGGRHATPSDGGAKREMLHDRRR